MAHESANEKLPGEQNSCNQTGVWYNNQANQGVNVAKESYIVVHPFRDYHSELEPNEAEFTEFIPWAELTTEGRASVLRSQAAYDYMLNDERWVHEAGVPEEWAEYVGSDDFKFGELEPIGMVKLAARVCEGNPNYTNFLNPAFRRISKGV